MKNQRSNLLAERLEQGAQALATLASGLSDAEWQTRVPHDGRKIGVMVHHVGNMYPLEMQVSRLLAAGKPVQGVTVDVIAEINAKHARELDGVTKDAAITFVRKNSAAAAAEIRGLTDAELDRAATISYNADAPLTCQFWLEDHPVRHSYHHLARMKTALQQRQLESKTAA
jgi:ribosomal protein L29